MAHTCSKEHLPYIIGRDFDIMCHCKDKNKDNIHAKWPYLFNMVIQSLDRKEIEMHGHYYTWAGSGDNPTFEKLDRVLASIECEHKIPLTTVHARYRSNSDHKLLLWNTGASSHIKQQPLFKFERG